MYSYFDSVFTLQPKNKKLQKKLAQNRLEKKVLKQKVKNQKIKIMMQMIWVL